MPIAVHRVLLAILAAGVAGSAAIGLIAVANGRFGETDVRLIATLIAIFLCASAGLASLALLERGQIRPVALLVLLAAPLELIAMAAPIWTFEGDGEGNSLRWLATGFVWVVAGIFVTALRLLVADQRVLRVMLPLVGAFAFGHAVAVTVVAWGEPWSEDSEDALARTIAALAILMVAAFLITPIVERLIRTRGPAQARLA
jgi:peptidoglycan/LPS O-acetylase OafA/YrhL